MKLFFAIIISMVFLSFFACEPPIPEEDTPLEHKAESMIHQIPEGDLEILKIEGCEYIIYKEIEGSNRGFGYLSHKGNCKNPIHIYQNPDIVNDTLQNDSIPVAGGDTIHED